MPGPRRLLILGGTGEAAALARGLIAGFGDRLEVISSLAGRVVAPAAPPGRVRVGGFGGWEGLAAYLRTEQVELVVDATHPFAARISDHAARACAAVGVERLMVVRPPWSKQPGDRWVEVADMSAAAEVVPSLGRRAFLTVGVQEVAPFARCRGVWFLVRLIAPAPMPLANYTVVTGRGPFSLEDERRLLGEHGIEVVVTKASGGAATYAKIEAARAAGLPVVMVRRPPLPEGAVVDSVGAAMTWVSERMGGGGGE